MVDTSEVTNISSSRVIGHIVALDDIHRIRLIKRLQRDGSICLLDLDLQQMKVYNSLEMVEWRKQFHHIHDRIVRWKKQLKLVVDEKIQSKLAREQEKLKKIRKKMQMLWSESMIEFITETSSMRNCNNCGILYIGSNMYPGDYRIAIDLMLPSSSLKIIAEYDANMYAVHQIKYYLSTQKKRISTGGFPLDNLRTEYLTNKYDKFVSRYEKLGYQLIPYKKILQRPPIRDSIYDIIIMSDVVSHTSKNLSVSLVSIRSLEETSVRASEHEKNDTSLKTERIASKDVLFVALLYKSGETIVVTKGKPIQGYISKKEAIEAVKKRLKRPAPIYIYELDACQFEFVKGKYFSKEELIVVSNSETVMLTER